MKLNISIIDKLNELVPVFSNLGGLRDLAAEFEKNLGDLFELTAWGIYLYDFEKNRFRIVQAKGFTAEKLEKLEKEAMDGFPGIAFRTARLIYFPDMEQVKEPVSPAFIHEFNVRSRIYIPLMNNKRCVGTFGAVSTIPEYFSKEDISILTFICNLAGMAYGNILNKHNLELANLEIHNLSRIPAESPFPVLRISHDYFLLYANNSSKDFLEHYGISAEKPLPPEFRNYIDTVQKIKTNYQKEFSVGGRTYSMVFAPIAGTRYINVYGQDITRRKNYEKELLRLALIARKTDNAIIITSATGDIEWVNSAFISLTEYNADEVRHINLCDFLEKTGTDEAAIALVRKAIKEVSSIEVKLKSYRKSGEYYWGRMQFQPIFNNVNQLESFISFQKDITEERQFEEKLKANQERIQKIIESSLDGLIMIDSDSKILIWNKQAESIFGFSEKEALGQNMNKLIIFPKLQLSRRNWMDYFLKSGDTRIINRRIEITALKKNGEELPIELSVAAINNEGSRLFSAFVRDISERKKAENELFSVYSRMSALISNLNAAILVEDENHKIALLNNEFCSYFGIPASPETLYGQDSTNSAGQNKHLFKDPEQFVSRINELLEKKQPCFDEELDLIDGRCFSRDYIPIYKNRQFLGNLWQYRDITRQKEEAHMLSEARIQAEQANQAKSLFLANMSHEIRTPMNAIFGIARLLEDYNQNEEQQRLIEGLITSSESLLNIINDILDFSKIEAGLLVIDPVTFNLKEQLSRIMNSLEFKANEKFIELIFNYDEKIFPYQYSDATRISQVLTNLVNNAIKFTEIGSVEMGCRLIDEDNESNIILFWVKDTGIGIEEKNAERIFESFQQEDPGTYGKFGGTGLGLSISKQIVEKLGGEIKVKSSKGQGSAFSFQLKLKKGNEKEYFKSNVKTTIDPHKLAGKELLLVEDVPINQFVIRSIIEKWNIKVTTAMHGKGAIELLKHQHFDIILMDKQMPVMNGLEATIYIRQKMNLDIPIIALTANTVKEVISQCYEAGMNDYISKPFEPYILYEKIARLLGINTDNEEVIITEQNHSRESEKLYDISKLERMLNYDREKTSEMIGQICQYISPYLEELMDHFRNGNMEGLAKSAHKFKSSLLLIGNQKIGNLIKIIEEYASNDKNHDELKLLVPRFEELTKEMHEQLKEDF